MFAFSHVGEDAGAAIRTEEQRKEGAGSGHFLSGMYLTPEDVFFRIS